MTTAEAPSVICEALAAVMSLVPSTGLSLASPARLLAKRMPPSTSAEGSSSSANWPDLAAAAALRWLSKANQSCRSREILNWSDSVWAVPAIETSPIAKPSVIA